MYIGLIVQHFVQKFQCPTPTPQKRNRTKAWCNQWQCCVHLFHLIDHGTKNSTWHIVEMQSIFVEGGRNPELWVRYIELHFTSLTTHTQSFWDVGRAYSADSPGPGSLGSTPAPTWNQHKGTDWRDSTDRSDCRRRETWVRAEPVRRCTEEVGLKWGESSHH